MQVTSAIEIMETYRQWSLNWWHFVGLLKLFKRSHTVSMNWAVNIFVRCSWHGNYNGDITPLAVIRRDARRHKVAYCFLSDSATTTVICWRRWSSVVMATLPTVHWHERILYTYQRQWAYSWEFLSCGSKGYRAFIPRIKHEPQQPGGSSSSFLACTTKSA